MGLYLALLLENDREPTAMEYKRCPLELEPIDSDSYVNESAVVFPWSRSHWGRLVALALVDAPEGGALVLKFPLPDDQIHVIDVDTRVELPAKGVVITGLPQPLYRPITIWTMLKEGDL